jgi:2-phosphosulfolactate phosphatase
MIFNQFAFDIRLEWGLKGLEVLAPDADLVIIVDVLSFSTCVDIATSRGAFIYPYRWKDSSAIEYARSINAELASFERDIVSDLSLSPQSLLNVIPGTKLVLPSANGSELSLSFTGKPVICGCLRNAKAVASFAMKTARKIAVIAAGEKWPDDTMRAALEDLIGAGAVISYLSGSMSPEAKSAAAVFHSLGADILHEVKQCGSGKELIERGFLTDVELACMFNASDNIPVLQDGCFTRKTNPGIVPNP